MKSTKFLLTLIGILFFLCIQGNAQNDKDEYLKLIGDQDADFEKTSVPDKWLNESAVIIAEKQHYSNNKIVSNDMVLKSSFRRRIKLMDKASVLEFSFFYFQDDDDDINTSDSLQILVTKLNGTSNLVNLLSAVKVEEAYQVPSIFKGIYNSSYKKIAISNLEIGDIIDYCMIHTIKTHINSFGGTYAFPKFTHIINYEYPTLKYKHIISFPSKAASKREGYLSVLLKRYNGVPAIKRETIGDMLFFNIEMENIEKAKNEKWCIETKSAPTIVGCIYYIKNNVEVPIPSFYNPIPFDVKESLSEEDVKECEFRYFNQYIQPTFGPSAEAGDIIRFLRNFRKETTDPAEIVKICYYYYRTASAFIVPDGWTTFPNNNVYFINTMKIVFKEKSIPYSIVSGTDIKTNGINMIKPEIGKTVYLTLRDVASHWDDIDESLQGMDAYEIIMEKNIESSSIKKIKLPVDSSNKNGIWDRTDYSIDENFEILNVINEKKIKGKNRYDYYDFILLTDEMKYYDLKTHHKPNYIPPSDNIKKESKKVDNDRKKNASYEDQKIERLKSLKKNIEEDFEVESYDEFNLVQDGRHYDKKDLIIQQKYKIKGIIQKAGDNYIFNAGKLIGRQLEIKEDELKRQNDIYLPSPRTFNYSITVSIPIGYIIEGIEKLNFNVVKASGSFVSKASIEGDKLKLEVSKIYNHNFEKKEEWSSMVEFLDACYDFTETKVLIKKK